MRPVHYVSLVHDYATREWLHELQARDTEDQVSVVIYCVVAGIAWTLVALVAVW